MGSSSGGGNAPSNKPTNRNRNRNNNNDGGGSDNNNVSNKPKVAPKPTTYVDSGTAEKAQKPAMGLSLIHI